jgi:translocation and assembly module TamB
MRLRFDLSGLVARALIIDEWTIGRAAFEASPASADAAASPGASSLPVLMLIRSLRLGSIAITIEDRMYALGRTQLGVRYVDGSLEVSDFSTRWQGLEIDATVRADLDRAVEVDVSACVRGSYAAEAIIGCARIGGIYPALTISAQTTAPFAASADGSVTLGAPGTVDIALRWRNAALGRVPQLRSPETALRIVGPMNQLRLRGEGVLVYQEREFEIRVSALQRSDTVLVESLSVSNADASVVMSGEIATDFSRAALTVAGSHLDPSLFYPDWRGDLEFLGDIVVRGGAAPSVRLDDVTIGGELRGYPVAATGELDIQADTVTLRDIRLLSRADQVALAGTVGAATDLAVRAEISDLAAWWPDLQGELDADLLIRGDTAAPRVTGELLLRNGQYEGNRIARLVVSGEAGLAESDAMNLVADLFGFQTGDLRVDEMNAEIAGTLAAHSAVIRARADQWSLAARTRGGLAGGEWRGEIAALEIDPAILESWVLERPSRIAISRSSVQLEEACLAYLEARLCAAGTRAGEPADFIRVDATEFDVDILSPLLPAGVDIAGTLDAVIEIVNLSDRPNGRIVIDGRNGELHTEITAGADIDVPFEQLAVEATIVEGRLAMRGEFETPEFASGTLDLTIESFDQSDSPIDANLDFVWLNPAALTVLSPDVGDVSGTIYADVSVTGRVDEPVFAGEARLENGTIEVPVWGLLIERISGRATITDANRATYDAQGFIDDAALRIDGETELAPELGFPTTLRLQGDAIRLVQSTEAEVIVSPDLRATLALPNVSVSGRVDIPSARITAVGLSEQAATPSRDTIVHGREEASPDRPLAVSANLIVSLGDDVRYQDAKINAQVSGDLEMTYESELGATAIGALVLTGEYDAYSNPLTLEQGRLIFAGPWSNPSLDVRAVRRIDETTVGVQLTGTLAEPQTRIFSDPAMSETNALSYLLFGRPLDNAEDQNTAALENAALSMGLRQALPAIERIGETLRLDEFAIRGTATDAGALMAGKYLSPNLYIRYSYGLFNRIGGLLLRYRINDRLSLETLSGEQKSMDLLYTVEKE